MLWYMAYVHLQYSCKQVNTHIKFHEEQQQKSKSDKRNDLLFLNAPNLNKKM